MSRSVLPFVPIVLLAAGCASTDEGEAAGNTVTSAATQVDKGLAELNATLLSLKDLVQKPAPDLAPQFKTFKSNLADLESTAEDVAELAEQMETRSREYFAKWDAQLASVQNEDIRERSEKRREAVAAGFEKIKSEYTEVRGEFRPLLDNLRDVRTVLANDLTMSGLKSIEDTVDDIEDEHEDVRESLEELAKKFHELGVKLSQKGPPPESPKP